MIAKRSGEKRRVTEGLAQEGKKNQVQLSVNLQREEKEGKTKRGIKNTAINRN
jgi:hypothetical protein